MEVPIKPSTELTEEELKAAQAMQDHLITALDAALKSWSAGGPTLFGMQSMALALANMAGTLLADVPRPHRAQAVIHVIEMLAEAAGARALLVAVDPKAKMDS